jgi:Ca2+-binding EF-hand superfamily protein
MLRETMVDRFQHLDADGDGAITSDEMSAIANRMKRMHGNGMNDGGMHGTGMGGHQMMQGMSDQE